MIYTIIYKDKDDKMDTFTFVSSKHCKNYAWGEYNEKYSHGRGVPLAIAPGDQIIFFPQHIFFT